MTLREPVRLTARAVRAPDKVSVESVELKAAGIDVTGGGDLEAGVKLSGTVDLVALTAQLRDVLDLGAFDLSGHARLAADYQKVGESFKGRFAADCKDLKVVGMTAEPIVRDLVRLDASAVGPAGPDGMPGDWQEARLDLKAGDLKLDLARDLEGRGRGDGRRRRDGRGLARRPAGSRRRRHSAARVLGLDIDELAGRAHAERPQGRAGGRRPGGPGAPRPGLGRRACSSRSRASPSGPSASGREGPGSRAWVGPMSRSSSKRPSSATSPRSTACSRPGRARP